jgi:hypothetical protein
MIPRAFNDKSNPKHSESTIRARAGKDPLLGKKSTAHSSLDIYVPTGATDGVIVPFHVTDTFSVRFTEENMHRNSGDRKR